MYLPQASGNASDSQGSSLLVFSPASLAGNFGAPLRVSHLHGDEFGDDQDFEEVARVDVSEDPLRVNNLEVHFDEE